MAFADDVETKDPIVIDDFRPKAHRFAISFGADYRYYSKNTLGLTFVVAGNSSTGSLYIPLTVNSNKQRNTGTFSLGLSTSLNERLTLRSKVRALIGREVDAHYNVETGTQTYFKFGDASIGFTYQVTPLTNTAFLSVFGDYNLIENSSGDISLGKTFSVGAALSVLSDPLLFSLCLAYARIGSVDNSKYHDLAGNYLMVSPNLTFSVNEKTSLMGGMSAAIVIGNNGESETQEVTSMV